ncbi:MAG TPA: hypothetical protein ENJ05_06815 [Thiotrichales bacterium]|nr:hypothetical protein [Thiotrichales bacterium]
MVKKEILILSLVLLLPLEVAAAMPVDWLLYQEREPGVDPYPVRILVSERFMRIDDGYEGSDFVLFDRRARTIFSITREEKSMLVIHDSVFDRQSGAPDIEVRVTQPKGAPKIAGRQVKEFEMHAGGDLCLSASVVPGLLPDVSQALAEYQQVLAARQFRDLDKTPPELRTPCFLANYVYGNERHLQHGLPIREAVTGGRMRVLMDYRAGAAMDEALFELPKGYRRLELGGGAD